MLVLTSPWWLGRAQYFDSLMTGQSYCGHCNSQEKESEIIQNHAQDWLDKKDRLLALIIHPPICT